MIVIVSGLIPAIREPKVCAYYFGEKPVKSIIFTGKKYQAAHQKVIMSGLGGGKNSQGANFERKSGLVAMKVFGFSKNSSGEFI